MNVLFILLKCPDLNQAALDSLYSDLAIEFNDNGHQVTIIAPSLKNQNTGIYKERNIDILRVKTRESLDVSNFVKKGLAQILLPYDYKRAYNKYLSNSIFDLILMPTPPITLIDFTLYVKKKTGGIFYLILRDIHPQSFWSIGLTRNPLIYKFLEIKSNKAYKAADYIGCMSQGNIEFVKGIAPSIEEEKIVFLPNWQKFKEYSNPDENIRSKYGLKNKFVAVFGGTIGAGQEISNIITLAKYFKHNDKIVFLIIGKGIRKQYLIDEAKKLKLDNFLFLDYLPRNEYDELLKTADVGIITIDHRYKVPTCPSKVIGYMAMKIPVIAMINNNSDYGETYIDKPKCGLWSEDLDNVKMINNFKYLYENSDVRKMMGEAGYQYYKKNFTSKNAYNNIVDLLKLD